MAEFTITATLTFRGAIMSVEASSEEEARALAESDPDFDVSFAELTDWRVTKVEQET